MHKITIKNTKNSTICVGLTTKNYKETEGKFWSKNNGIWWLHSNNGYMTYENYEAILYFVIELRNSQENALFIDDSATGHLNKRINQYIINCGYILKRIPGGGTAHVAVNDRPRLNGYVKQQIRKYGRQMIGKYAINIANVCYIFCLFFCICFSIGILFLVENNKIFFIEQKICVQKK